MRDPNRHLLYRHLGPGPVELCWRLRARSDLDLLRRREGTCDTHDGFLGMMAELDDRYPHGPDCTACHGTNIMPRQQVTIAWWCGGCGQRGQRSDFEESSCLGLGAGFYEEQRADHNWHRSGEVDACPACAEVRAARRWLQRQEEGNQTVAGMLAYAEMFR